MPGADLLDTHGLASLGNAARQVTGPLSVIDVAPFIGSTLMRVGGRGHAAAPDCAASRGVGPWRAECV